MGKVNWEEAKLLYIKDSRVSYSKLADYYGVAKPTIQQHATKHKWVELRSKVSKQRLNTILAEAGESQEEHKTRHIKQFKYMQVSALRAIRLINDEIIAGHISGGQAGELATLSRVLKDSIVQERLTSGIQYKPIRHHLDMGISFKPLKPSKPLTLDQLIIVTEKKLKRLHRLKSMQNNQDNS